MDALPIVAALVGIGAGIVAILQWFFGFIPKRTNYKKLFEQEFQIWKDSDHSHIMDEATLKKLIGHMLKKVKTEEKQTFCLLNANHYGNKSLGKFLDLNRENYFAIPFIFDSVVGKGTRVGWRAEFILTQMNNTKVSEFIENLPNKIKSNQPYTESIDRILNRTLEIFLIKLKNGSDQKLKNYAHEVLIQINSAKVSSNQTSLDKSIALPQ